MTLETRRTTAEELLRMPDDGFRYGYRRLRRGARVEAVYRGAVRPERVKFVPRSESPDRGDSGS
jgi:hypothetical protein